MTAWLTLFWTRVFQDESLACHLPAWPDPTRFKLVMAKYYYDNGGSYELEEHTVRSEGLAIQAAMSIMCDHKDDKTKLADMRREMPLFPLRQHAKELLSDHGFRSDQGPGRHRYPRLGAFEVDKADVQAALVAASASAAAVSSSLVVEAPIAQAAASSQVLSAAG